MRSNRFCLGMGMLLLSVSAAACASQNTTQSTSTVMESSRDSGEESASRAAQGTSATGSASGAENESLASAPSGSGAESIAASPDIITETKSDPTANGAAAVNTSETSADAVPENIPAVNYDKTTGRGDVELFAMDTFMTLSAYGEHAKEALTAGAAEIMRLDDALSISNPDGDIYRANAQGSADVSDETLQVIEQGLAYSAETNGLFDITIEPVMSLWGFPTKNFRVPSDAELKAALQHVNYKNIKVNGSNVSMPQGTQLDLGGIAKGYTSARVIDIFRQNGVSSALISLGGNVQTLGKKPDGSSWRIGIQDPRDPDSTFAIIQADDVAVITSGAYQRYFEQDGKRYHHIIDPRTGYPAENGIISSTIITKDGTRGDALSTSLFIMGVEEASDFWRAHQNDFDAVLMDDKGTVYVTAGLANRCQITSGDPIQIIQ